MKTNRPSIIITIDGPAGTGKSSVAHRLAERLGLEFLDTGAMYRAAALVAIEERIDPDDGPALAEAVARADLSFDWTVRPPAIKLGDRDVGERIREMDVGRIVSSVARQKELRTVLVNAQRRIAKLHPRIVTEGRDQGSVVFPDAPVRFYLDADESVRADRRARQLAAAGRPPRREEVIRDIRTRDRIDSTRDEGPLIRPEGAIVIDTSRASLDEVVSTLESIVREQIGDAGFSS